VSVSYGLVTSLALDPIEKKPLACYKPGTRILSVGTFGCNFRCPFCQNHHISMAGLGDSPGLEEISPQELAAKAGELAPMGNIGLAFTYNEPLVGFEFVRDTAALVKGRGLDTVIVTNGCISPARFTELLPLVDAMNIDLKAFSPEFYTRISGSLETVKANVALAAEGCHLELTCLIIPGENDSDREMDALCGFVASLSPEIPLHITRFFPRYRYARKEATPVGTLRRLKGVAEKRLTRVFVGNV
jgi:pyruvate formate lyase activating enzyme